MFAVPGICGLIIFILVRPQEFITPLAKLQLLYVFSAAAVFGFALDLRLRRLEPRGVPTLPLVIAFAIWVLLCNAVKIPDQFIGKAIELAILLVLYTTIAHACQRFRTLQVVAGAIMASALFISVVCFHQGLQPHQCVQMIDEEGEGVAEDRDCDTAEACYLDAPNPSADYRCERVGMFQTNTIEDRVRYRGELHDPNEVALTISIGGLSFLIAFFLRRKTTLATVLGILAICVVAYTVLLTKSRGGLIVAAAVPGVYFVRRYGFAGLIGAGLAALPLLAIAGGGRDEASAEASTAFRYEAWGQGLSMFHGSPIFGVGQRQFSEHHWLAAHNSYVLSLAELGIVGMVLFVSILYLSIKTMVVGIRRLELIPGAAVARVWGMAILAALLGLAFQIQTLSFLWHSVLWIFFGIAGAWVSAVRRHAPEFDVRMTVLDVVAVTGACLAYALVILPLFLRWKGAL